MIQKVNSSITFNGVYLYPDKTLFNEKQVDVANDIISKFHACVPKHKKKQTYESLYANKGIDFIIAPNDRYLDTDSVILFYTKDLNVIEKDSERKIIFSDKNRIGIYDQSRPFDIKDTDVLKNNKNNFLMDILAYVSLAASVCLMALIGTKFHTNEKCVNQKTNTILSDTISSINKDSNVISPKFNIRK